MKFVFFYILCLASSYGRVAVDEHRDAVINIIVDNKPAKTRPDAISNTSERTNVSESNIKEKIHQNVTRNEVLGDVKETVNATSEKSEVSDNLINVKLSVKNETSNILLSEVKDPCEKSKDQLDNLINPVLDICKPERKEPVDNGTALLLTKYIKEGRYKEARAASKVDSSVFLGIKSYSGFITVNETYNSNIFFWYFPVLNKSVTESPWIIWLQGGPGASSLTGLFDELGPFTVVNDILKRNPYTWLQNHSIVFIDNPVGTGYSFTDHADGYVTDMTGYASHLYTTLKQFLTIFPELKTAPLYIAGESYAGKYVPAMAMEIHKRNQNLPSPAINLQGMIIGNAYVDPDMIAHLQWPFYYFGLLVKEQIEIVKPLVDSFHQDIRANRSVEAKNKWNSLVTVLLFLSHQKQAYNFLRDDLAVGRYIRFLKTSEVKKAIHVGDINFSFVNMTVNTKLAPDFLSTTKPLFERLLDHYRVLAYCGQLDQMLPCVFTSENYRTWKWNATEEFINATRFPYIHNNRLAGYHKTGGHLTEVVIRGAGHMVPVDAPAPIQNLVTRWTHEKPLSVRYGLLEGSFVQEFVRNNSLAYYI